MSATVPLSIILPVRNAMHSVGAAVDSVRAQRWSHWQLILVDDGSTDDSLARARAAAGSDTRVRILERPAQGLVPALNAGLAAVAEPCRYVARMDADDRMHPDRLGCQVRFLDANPAITVASSHVVLEPATSGLLRYVHWLNSLVTWADIERQLYVESPVCHPGVLLRRSALVAAKGYRDHAWPEDYDLWLRLCAAGARIAQAPGAQHVWCDSPGRLTRTDPRYGSDRFLALKAHFLAKRGPKRVSIWGAGRDGRRLARALEKEGVAIHTFIDIDPRKIGGVRRGTVPVIGPDALPGPGAGEPIIITAVGVPGARDKIRADLCARGYEELRDFVCAA